MVRPEEQFPSLIDQRAMLLEADQPQILTGIIPEVVLAQGSVEKIDALPH